MNAGTAASTQPQKFDDPIILLQFNILKSIDTNITILTRKQNNTLFYRRIDVKFRMQAYSEFGNNDIAEDNDLRDRYEDDAE